LVGYPNLYNRVKVGLKKQPFSEGEALIDGEVYIMIEKTMLK